MKCADYIVYVTISTYTCGLKKLQQRFNDLYNIGFECTLSEYHTKEQRKRMTKTLREETALRDKYTCRICGKYKGDGVGLNILTILFRLPKVGKAFRQTYKFCAQSVMGKDLLIR